MHSHQRFQTFLLITAVTALGWRDAAAEPVVFARHLALSPNGETLAFSWAGDIWTVATAGGTATRLTVNPAHESYPVWSRDGSRIAFASSRHGAANVFVMARDGSGVRRISFSDRSETPTDWSLDNQTIYFHSRREGQIYREPIVYKIPVSIGQAWPALDCFAASARLSPDGSHFAFTRGGSRTWRRHYRGSANHDVWLQNTKTGEFRQFTRFEGTDRLPTWDADGRGLYFVSDRNGIKNVWYQPLEGGTARQITTLEGDDLRDYAVSADGKTLVFTQWDKIFSQTLPDGEPRQIEISAGGDSPVQPIDLRTFTSGAEEVEASPDGKELALVVHGEIFVIKTEPKKSTRRVTRSPYRDRDVVWSPDGKALFFISDRAGQEDIYRALSAEKPAKALSESLRFTIERVTDNPQIESQPRVSPDGKKLSFTRGRGDLYVRDLKSGEETLLFESWNQPTVRWSADSEWLAYAVEDVEFNSDVWIVPADGGKPAVNVSQHPDNDSNPQWSADGQVLAFASQRDGTETDLYLVFLSPKLNEDSSVDFDAYFKKAGEKAKKLKPAKSSVASGKIHLAGSEPKEDEPDEAKKSEDDDKEGVAKLKSWLRKVVKNILDEPDNDDSDKTKKEEEDKAEKYAYELETAYQRIRRVTNLPGDQFSFALAPSGELLVFGSRHEGSSALFQIKWNGQDRKKIVSTAAGALHWQLDGSRLFYLRDGVPNSCKADGSDAKSHAFRGKIAIDRAAEAAQKFDDAARALGLRFYHPTLKDLDWQALTEKYRALALKTRTVNEFNEVFNLLQGELNGSHLGISGGGPRGSRESIGYLGCSFDRTYPGPGLKVADITRKTPAFRDESRLVPGDIILSVNGEPVGPDSPIERALIDTVDDPVILELQPSPEREADDEDAEEEDDEANDEDNGSASNDSNASDDADEEPDGETATLEVVIRPTSYGGFAARRYEAWVEANRKYVEDKSDGRIGYLHIRGMNESSFYTFERDLYAAAHGKDGLIIDVRNNGGGWTADWVMAVLSVRRHAYTIPRGGERGYPQGRLIFYAWTKPATMMCNQYSYSNAEIISHAFKNLGRGPLVGRTTFGAVISTGSYGLIDGARIRMPFRGWYTLPAGKDMEDKGAVPDVELPVTPADEVNGRFPQLDAAIAATQAEIAKSTAQR